MATRSQFVLLRERRFAPLFWTQFLGAANDNLFKFAFTLLATYQAAAWGGGDGTTAGFVIGAVFIAPFLLFSATAGQLADKLERAGLIRFVKNLEVGVMLLAAAGFATHRVAVLYGCVFLMGLHSTIFGPVKYAYLPQHLKDVELTGGNGLVEMGTFVAILLGTMAGGTLVKSSDAGAQLVAAACVLVAVLGRVAAHFTPIRRRRSRSCASTGTRSRRRGRTSASPRACPRSSTPCSASRGCGFSARSSSPRWRRSRARCWAATSPW